MPWVNPVINPATMIRREAAMKIGFYDEAFQVASDYDFYFRLAQVSKIANLDEPLIEYETGHFHSISSSRKFLQHWNTLQIRLRYFDPLHPYAYLGVAKALIQLARFHPASRRLCGGAKAIKA
jgi:hypothetical protein